MLQILLDKAYDYQAIFFWTFPMKINVYFK